MLKRQLLIGMVIGGLMGSGAQEQDVLLQDLDIPLYAGLAEDKDGRVVFDQPEGRIIQSRATGMVEATKVSDFYRIVLPALGWKIPQNRPKEAECATGTDYCIQAERDSERLIIAITSAASSSKQTVTDFSLYPRDVTAE